MAPEFLKGASAQEWLGQYQVRQDLLSLAVSRVLSDEADHQAELRLITAYQAQTGEAEVFAVGACEVVLNIMMAGLKASVISRTNSAQAGLIQSEHRSTVDAQAAQLGAILKKLDPIAPMLEALTNRATELRTLGVLHPLDLATAFTSNTAAARISPEIPGLGQIDRPEVDLLLSTLSSGPTLLIGPGGIGKSGLVSLLVDQFQATGDGVLLIDASLLPRSAVTPSDVGASLVEPIPINEAIKIVAADRHVTFIVDQLDTVATSDTGKALIQLLRSVATTPNVGVLVVCRTFQADRVREIAELGFNRFDAEALTDRRAIEALHQLGLAETPGALVTLATNLLDLSIIASLVRRGINVVQIDGEVQLWDAYRIESENASAVGRAVEGAWLAAEEGRQTVAPSLVSDDQALDALMSRGAIVSTAARYQFRHERIRDYLVAWDAARHPHPLAEVVGRLPHESLVGVLRWLVTLTRSDPELEREIVDGVLDDEGLTFDIRAVVLETVKSDPNPSADIAEALAQHLAHEGYSRLFFEGLGPAWLVPFATNGAFAQTPDTPGAYWPALNYLKVQVTAQPAEVAQIIESMQVRSAWMIADLLEIATALPLELASGVAEALAAAIPTTRLTHLHTSRSAAVLAAALAKAVYPRQH